MSRHADGRPSIAAWLFVTAMVLNIFSGNFDLLGLPLPLDRGVLALSLLALVVEGGDSHRRNTTWRPVHLVLIASVLLTTGSSVWAGTITTPPGFFALLDRVVMPALLFCLAPHFLPTPAARQLFVKAFVLLGLYLAAVSTFSVLGPTALVVPRYVMDPSVGILFGRARGPFVEASANGLALISCAFLAAAAWWLLSPRWRVPAVLTVLGCSLGVLLTYTRSIWLGAAVGALVYCLAQPQLRRFTPALAAAAAATAAAVILLVPSVGAAVVERFGNQRSIDDRTTTNDAALRAFDQHPLTGVGWNRFLSVVEDHVRQQDLVPLTNVEIEAHNVLLSRASELGVPGAVLWVLTVLLVVGHACWRRPEEADLQRWRFALLGLAPGYLAVAMLTPLSAAASNSVAFVVAGVVLAGYQSRPASPRAAPPPLQRRTPALAEA